MWYLVKFNPKSGKAIKVEQHLTINGAKGSFDDGR
jgi:hypothetical protein